MVGTGCVATSLREFLDGPAVRIGSLRDRAAARFCSSSRAGSLTNNSLSELFLFIRLQPKPPVLACSPFLGKNSTVLAVGRPHNQRSHSALQYLFRCSLRGNDQQKAAPAIVLNQRLGAPAIGLHAHPNRLRTVVLALYKFAATLRANLRHGCGDMRNHITIGANPPAGPRTVGTGP